MVFVSAAPVMIPDAANRGRLARIRAERAVDQDGHVVLRGLPLAMAPECQGLSYLMGDALADAGYASVEVVEWWRTIAPGPRRDFLADARTA